MNRNFRRKSVSIGSPPFVLYEANTYGKSSYSFYLLFASNEIRFIDSLHKMFSNVRYLYYVYNILHVLYVYV